MCSIVQGLPDYINGGSTGDLVLGMKPRMKREVRLTLLGKAMTSMHSSLHVVLNTSFVVFFLFLLLLAPLSSISWDIELLDVRCTQNRMEIDEETQGIEVMDIDE